MSKKSKVRAKKRILGWLLIMTMVFVSMESTVQAATYKEAPIRNQAGYDFSLLMSDTRNGWDGIQIGEYCVVEVGQRITPSYSGFGYTNMGYYTTSGGAISIYENMEQLPSATINNRPIYRTLLPKKPTDLHMAYEANMKWCVERVNPINHEVYVGPGYDETEGHMMTEVTPNYKVYPSINYYGVNYNLDAGSWKDKAAWVESKDGKDYGIWKSTKQQYKEDGNLYENNIWFAYEGFEVALPAMDDVVKEGYELRGWGTTTGSAIEVTPGGSYTTLSSNAEYRTEWGQENIEIKALWEPKNIGVQEVNNIKQKEATFTADFSAYYDLTDKGFMYKKSSDKEWMDVKAVEKDGKLTAAITGLDTATSYDVKGYLENKTGKIENNVITFKTQEIQSAGGGIGIPATDTTVTVTTNTKDASPSVTSVTTTQAKSDAYGKASATVTESQVKTAVNKALEEATKQGEGTAAKVEIKITAPAKTKAVEASLPKAALTQVAESKIDSMAVFTPETIITFDKTAVTTIAKEATNDVKITASKVDTAELSKETRAVVGDRPVFNFSVTSANKTISQFGGTVTVSVPYTPKAGEDTNAIVIYYINAKGKAEIVKECAYNKETGMVTFKTNHFSKYAVGYHKVNFKDVPETAGYADAVSYLAAREITKGTGNGNFSPKNTLTRGQLLVMVMKAYGIEPTSGVSGNFKDAGNAYYTDYLATAKKLGIDEGVKNNKFAPNKKLTRQEMFALLYDILKQIDKLPSATTDQTLTDYSDADQIAKWAKEPMALFVKSGIVGASGDKLNPKGSANRALVAQVLYDLAKK